MDIGKKDVMWGYVSLILVQGINALLLPFVLMFLTSSELGLWYTFTSLYGLAMLIDFGFQATITRHVSYIWSGSNDISKEGYKIVETSVKWNKNFFIEILSTIKFLYYSMGSIITLLLTTVGTFYVYTISQEEIDLAISLSSWIIYMTAIILNITFSFWNAFLRGIGAIRHFNQSLIISKVVQLILSILLLLSGYGILGISIAYLASVIIGRITLSKFFYNFHEKTKELKGSLKPKLKKGLIMKLLPNTIKTGLVSVSNYFILNFPILLTSYFLSLEISGQFGLVNQIITLILTISNSYFNTYLSQFNYYRIKNKVNAIITLFKKSILINYLINGLSFFLLIVIGDKIINIIAETQDLLPLNIMVIVIVYRFLYNNQTLSVTLISTKNTIPHYKAFLISAILTIIVQVISLNIYQSIYSVILPILIIQLLYNNWYWPKEAVSDLKEDKYVSTT